MKEGVREVGRGGRGVNGNQLHAVVTFQLDQSLFEFP